MEPLESRQSQLDPRGAEVVAPTSAASAPPAPLRIVGIGASAGGLEALERLFSKMPEDTGMAFVVVQHLSPDFKSLMDELLARWTSMPVRAAEEAVRIQANAIYLMPPKKEMIISDGKLLLTDKGPADELTLPIDQFFRSLARDAGAKSVAIVLSGTGSDGSRGIRDVHEAGGLVIAQSDETAKFDGMPKSAVETNIVDLVLAPEQIPDALLKHINDPRATLVEEETTTDVHDMLPIFRLLQQAYGIDFSYYKPTTVRRRTERRLQLIHVEDLNSYLERLRIDRDELDALYRDLLIGVTGFFRDDAAFRSIEEKILPKLLQKLRPGEEFRAWVAGCATGEEAYSLAILVHEQLERLGRPCKAKIFATDVHKTSLETAGCGVYNEAAVAGLSADRLHKYFSYNGDGFQISTELRQMVVFAPHNITKDAPFTRLDLITCRNLLIYLQPAAQKKALSLFHFALKAGGVLFLGPSESPGDLSDEFDTVDRQWKIFSKRRDVRLPADLRLPLFAGYETRISSEMSMAAKAADRQMVELFETLFEQALPPSVLLNEHREIIHTFGRADRYLRMFRGKPSLDVLDLLQDDLRLAAAGAIHRAGREHERVVFAGVRVTTLEGEEYLNLSATPISVARRRVSYTLLSFEPAELTPTVRENRADMDLAEASRSRVETLESELRYTKENLQATIEELEASNEELQATNQEMLASNEELQSTNEELHSVNEELFTVNAEYQKKIDELTVLTHDMDNLLVSTDVHTIFLDAELCIRKFTPKMAEVFNLIPADIGRRIDGFMHTIQCADLQDKIASVLSFGQTVEQEVSNKAGDNFLMRILPYRGDTERSGVVMTLIDITNLKQAEALFRNAVEAVPSGMLLTDRNGQITMINSEIERIFGYDRDELLGQSIELLIPDRFREQHQAHLRAFPHDPQLLPTGTGFDLMGVHKDGHEFPLDVRLSPIRRGQGVSILAAIVDMTDRKQLESSLRDQVVQRDRFLATLSHELRNPMAAILSAGSMLKRVGGEAPEIAQSCGVICRQSAQIATLLDDLLDVSRVTQNKIKLRREVADLTALAKEAVEAVAPLISRHHHTTHFQVPEGPLWADVDRARLLQVLENLLTNAAKYTPDHGNIWLELERVGPMAEIRVRDDGRGIAPELQASIFDMFVQSDDTLDRSEGGMGVGLTLVRSLVELHQGSIDVDSQGIGCGSQFMVRIPLADAPPAPQTPPAVSAVPQQLQLVLVEDSHDAREMLAALLDLEGYQVQTAADGRDGLDTIVRERPNVALVDVGLPKLDGFGVARAVRSKFTKQEIYLIALTGYGGEDDREAILQAGFDEHLVKPVGMQELNRALSKVPRPGGMSMTP